MDVSSQPDAAHDGAGVRDTKLQTQQQEWLRFAGLIDSKKLIGIGGQLAPDAGISLKPVTRPPSADPNWGRSQQSARFPAVGIRKSQSHPISQAKGVAAFFSGIGNRSWLQASIERRTGRFVLGQQLESQSGGDSAPPRSKNDIYGGRSYQAAACICVRIWTPRQSAPRTGVPNRCEFAMPENSTRLSVRRFT